MNKYLEALDDIKSRQYQDDWDNLCNVFDEDDEEIKIIQELVDRATPYKPDRDRGFPECSCGVGFHGKVENEVSDGLTINYCFSCGQALDWRKDE